VIVPISIGKKNKENALPIALGMEDIANIIDLQ
jgi:hypothetical protein